VAGNTETLVPYDKIGQLASQAKTLHVNNFNALDEASIERKDENIFDL
jgi:hypothetical protein